MMFQYSTTINENEAISKTTLFTKEVSLMSQRNTTINENEATSKTSLFTQEFEWVIQDTR